MNGMFDIVGKTALITGGSRGIGELIAEAFVANGVKTYCSSSNKWNRRSAYLMGESCSSFSGYAAYR